MTAVDLERNAAEERKRIVRDWDADRRPIHCANCRHCVVSGSPDAPIARCAMGYGKPLALHVMLREKGPRQFAPAKDCEDFSSMADGARRNP
jgi:hypothetical protein